MSKTERHHCASLCYTTKYIFQSVTFERRVERGEWRVGSGDCQNVMRWRRSKPAPGTKMGALVKTVKLVYTLVLEGLAEISSFI